MTLNIRKPINNPQYISILIPTRERPDYLRNLLDSIEETTKNKSLVDVWFYLDDDDYTTKQFIDARIIDKYSFKISYVFGPRTKTMGEMFNTLREKCTTNPGIYMPASDDYIYVTKNWDQIVRDAFNRYPDRILLAYADEPTTDSDVVIFVILSAEWTNLLGRILTEYFPFWYDDTWLDQVSQMVQRIIKLDIQMEPQGGRGKTPRMRNLLFWQRFFINTMEERIEDANILRRAIYTENSPEYYINLDEAKRLSNLFEKEFKKKRDDDLIFMEKYQSVYPENLTSHAYLSYQIIEEDAINHLCEKLCLMINKGRFIEASNIWNNLIVSSKNLDSQHSCITWRKYVWYLFRMMCRALRHPSKYPEYAKRIYSAF